MLSNWFGSGSASTDAPVYEEIPTPTTKEQYMEIVNKLKTKLLNSLSDGMMRNPPFPTYN